MWKKVYCAWCKKWHWNHFNYSWNFDMKSYVKIDFSDNCSSSVTISTQNRWGWTWGAIIVDLPLQFLRLLYPPLCRFKSWHICKSCWQLQGPFSYLYRSGCYNFIQEFVHSSRPKSIIPYYCKSKRKSVPNSNWCF